MYVISVLKYIVFENLKKYNIMMDMGARGILMGVMSNNEMPVRGWAHILLQTQRSNIVSEDSLSKEPVFDVKWVQFVGLVTT